MAPPSGSTAPPSRRAGCRSVSSDAPTSLAKRAAGAYARGTCSSDPASCSDHGPSCTLRGADAFAQDSIAFAQTSIGLPRAAIAFPRAAIAFPRAAIAFPRVAVGLPCGSNAFARTASAVEVEASADGSMAPSARWRGCSFPSATARASGKRGVQAERQPNITPITARFARKSEDSQKEDAYKWPSRSVCMVRGRASIFVRARRTARPALSAAGARGTRAFAAPR